LFNILIYKKAQGDFSIGIPCLNDTNLPHPRWNEYLDKYDLFNFVALKKKVGTRKKIPNTKYIVFISYYGHFISNTDFKPLYDCQLGEYISTTDSRRSEFYMPDRVRTDSENGLVHWVIDYNTECSQLDQTDNFNQIDFNRVCQLLHTVPNNITLITGGETVSELGTATLTSPDNLGYNCITGHELYNFINIRKGNDNDEAHNTYSSQKIRNIINGENLKYKSLCYNRLPRPHRTIIVAHIIKNNYHDDCLYSLGLYPNMPRWFTDAPFPPISKFPELSNEMNQLRTGPEIYPHIREGDVSLTVNLADTIGWEHGLTSYFQLVTETTPTAKNIPFITEKSMKPFAMLQPFVQYGPKDNIKVLRMYGYQMFDDWIDHSYDDEEDNSKRLRMVLTEFDRLQKIPKDIWSKMLQEMLSQLLHNNKLVKRPPIYDFTSQLIPILSKFIKAPQ